MFRYATVASFLALLGVVTSHGGGQHYIIDGAVHRGNWEYINNTDGSIQREWDWGHNIGSPDHPAMACGYPGTPHVNSYHAPIVAGNIVSVNYTLETVNEQLGRPWTFGHPYGSMLAYMAACPDEGCDKVDLKAPIWFKIWEAGLISGTWPDGYWAMKDVFEGANLDIPTPASLKPGKYIFRHEMINLQTGPVQFFPNCIHLEVSGTGSSLPEPDELVAFPGAYAKDVEKSFTLTDAVWFYVTHQHDTVYPLPGPPIWDGAISK